MLCRYSSWSCVTLRQRAASTQGYPKAEVADEPVSFLPYAYLAVPSATVCFPEEI